MLFAACGYAMIHAQTDSVLLKEVLITSYLDEKPILRLPSSVAVLDSNRLHANHGQSLVPALNTIPGVRMEERSPGSYRLSIRGSLLRSPFGIRNVKIYVDEFPLTNAGGETYLNLLDVNCMHSMEVLKGPDGSLFGANSGGVLKVIPVNAKSKSSFIKIGAGIGSFGLLQQRVGLQQNFENNTLFIDQSSQRTNGYRENSSMSRDYIQLADEFRYTEKGKLKFFIFFSDLNYKTPGGLTLSQFEKDPKQARPSTQFVPGAIDQKAGIRNRTLYGGVVNEYKFTGKIKHVIAMFGSKTNFENPFITNYETRMENNAGVRTWGEYKAGNSSANFTINIGAEGQTMHSFISNYGNDFGTIDTIQAIDDVNVMQGFVFTRAALDLENKWLFEGSLSYNYNRLVFSRKVPVQTNEFHRIFAPQLMPRLAVSWLLSNYFALRAIVSKGYSSPALQEIRASDNSVNTSLQPEQGWNYETGLRLKSKNGRVWCDIATYYYKLTNAIVRRVNETGQEYFINAGGTEQIGFESQLNISIIKQRNKKFIREVEWTNACTFQQFTFSAYRNGSSDYSGNTLTGVPRHTYVTGVTIGFPFNVYFSSQYNYTTEIPLDDANTVYADEYHLVQAKIRWKVLIKERFAIDLSCGADNLLDQTYSLGNDLNAVGGRYYNAAPKRNYFVRLGFKF